MEFWRIYRLIHSKRWLILAIMLIAATVIFAGVTLRAQRKMFEAEALVEPQDATLLDTVSRAAGADGSSGSQSLQQARSNNISDLIVLLRSSNDLYFKAADLMQSTEEERVREVQRILERNGYFASWDDQDEQQAQRLVRLGELTQAQARQQIARAKAETRKRLVDEWAKARDDLGAFAPTGVTQSDLEIAANIRKKMFFESIADPLSTENNPQVVNLVKIRSQFEREAEATLYTNMMVIAFVDYFTNKSAGAAVARIQQLEDKLEQAKRELRESRAAAVAYRRRTGDTLTSTEEAAVTNLLSYQNQKNAAELQFSAAQARVQQLDGLLARESNVKTTILPSEEDPLVRRLRERVAEARIAFSSVQESNLGENHEQYKSAKALLDKAEQELREARGRVFSTSTVNATYDSLRQQLADARVARDAAQAAIGRLNGQVARQQAMVSRIPAARAGLADLQLSVDINEKNVAQLQAAMQRLKLLNVEQQGKAGTINILSRAYTTPVGADIGKQRWKLMAYGMVLALIFGIALVVAMDALDNSIRTTTDVEKLLGLPICGVIPAQLPDPNRSPRITYLDPLSPVAEAYRLLRTDLLFTHAERPFQSLMVSTGKPGQGASTTICNLSIAFAQAGKRVILVDCDLRRPKLHNVFKVRNDTGLTSLLNDECTLEQALKPTEVDNLLILPSGPLPLNPAELIASPRMRALHEELKRHSDFVFFDTPSAIAFSDATILSSFVDAAIIVVRAHNVPRGSEHQVRQMLNKAKANIIGVVLNGMNPEHVDSVHYHYHYYPVLTSKNTLGALPSGPNGNGSNGHGKPLALPGGEGEDPVVTARRAATVPETAGSGGGGTGTVTTPHVSQSVGIDKDAVEPLPATAAPGVIEAEAARSAVTSHEGFLRVKRSSIWRRLKGVVIFLVMGLIIGALVLVLQNSVQP